MEIPWDSEHVVSPATRRQRQMAWVPAVGMSVIPQREREGKEREKRESSTQPGREKGVRTVLLFSSSAVCKRRSCSADSEEIFGNMHGAN